MTTLKALVYTAVALFVLLIINQGDGIGDVELWTDEARYSIPTGLHIVAVGINTYPTRQRYARADAEAVAEALQRSFKGPTHTQLILDERATRETIEAAMETVIADAKPDDVFVFYYAGYSHAVNDQEFYLLPATVEVRVEHGQKQLSGIDLPSQAISASLLKAWLSRLRADKQLVILDSSAGEHLVATLRSRMEGGDKRGSHLANRQLMVLGTEGMGYEESNLKHGIFTYDLLQGLSGDADRWPKDGLITAGELDVYIRSLTVLKKHNQTSVSARIGRDFAVAAIESIRGTVEDELPAQDKKSHTSNSGSGKDYALLIATDHYDAWKHLSNPIHDARAIAKDLQDMYGFETEILENPTRDQVWNAFGKYTRKVYSSNDQLIIFIAGHGMYLNDTKEGFLITKESKLPNEDKWGDSFLAHSRLSQIVNQIPTPHIFLMVDACFGGTFDQRIADSGHRGNDVYRELSGQEVKNRKMKYKTRRYLTSGRTEYVPDGRPGAHSPFARKLMEALRSDGGTDGYLTIGKIVDYVEKVIPEPRAGEFGSHDPGGDVILLRQGATRK